MPSVRRAAKHDRDRVADLWMAFLQEQAAQDARFQPADDARERFENDFPVWLEDETQRTFVAVEEGQHGEGEGSNAEERLVGFATAHRWGPPPIQAEAAEVFVDEFYVVPGARRRGTGHRLVDALRGWAGTVKAERMRLRVLHKNEAGRAFWQSVGGDPFGVTMTVELEPASKPDAGTRRRIGF